MTHSETNGSTNVNGGNGIPAGGLSSAGLSSGNGSPSRLIGNALNGGYAVKPGAPHIAQPNLHPHPPDDESHEGLAQILGRQWHVVALCTIASLLLGICYLLFTKPVYTAYSQIKVEPLNPSALSAGSNSADNTALVTTDFLETECATIKSTAVLALALDQIQQAGLMKNIPHPLDYLEQNVDADLSKQGLLIDVKFDSINQDEAVAVVNAVVDGYTTYNANAWRDRAKKLIGIMNAGQEDKQAKARQLEEDMNQLAQQMGHTPVVDPSKDPIRQQVQSLLEEKAKLQIEALNAKSAASEANRAIIGHADLLKAVDEQEQHVTPSADPQSQLKLVQDELYREQSQLTDLERTYLPKSPIVQQFQTRIDKLTVDEVVVATEWQQAAESKLDEMDEKLKESEKEELTQSRLELQYNDKQEQLRALTASKESMDQVASSIKLTEGAGAINIIPNIPGRITTDSPHPAARKSLAIAMVLGLIGGLGLACLRDWTDDRLRTIASIRTTVGAPMLGSIPVITSAHSTNDRGQIVHHDPFGEAAESYRTLRTALQFGLPVGTKTVLVTSPTAGEGKSTLVSNLGIALAQASRRVLIIDADLRAPVQHRLFDLPETIGLASVLGGGDPIEQAICHTSIEGLDVLPCGPIPSNPAELLNDPALHDHLNELADKYDLILIDSPPVTAVTDARILAASADTSLLVVRAYSSTRKQTIAARDGLRSVGARLIGVAVNAVTRNAGFTGSSGYYGRMDQPAPRFSSDANVP